MIKSEVRDVKLPAGPVSLTHAVWRYLKRFGAAGRTWKQCLQSMHSDTIWKCRFVVVENNANKELWRYLKRFGTEEIVLKTMFLKHAFWWYFKRFGTAKKMKTRMVNCFLWRYLKLPKKMKTRTVNAWCILTAFETICIFCVKTCECSPLTPNWPSFLGSPGLHQWETSIGIVYEHWPDTAE